VALKSDPNNVAALERYIFDRAAGGEVADAHLSSLFRRAPERARAHAVAAHLALLRGRTSEAEARLLAYRERHPRHAGAWLALAELDACTGQPTVALEMALTALTLAPHDRAIWLALCRILPLAGEPDESQRTVSEIRARFPDDAMLLGAAGTVAVTMENGALARELCARAVALQPEVASLRLRYASVLADSRRYDEAMSELAAATDLVRSDDGHADAARMALLMARLHACMGSSDDAGHAWAHIAAGRADALAAFDRAGAHAFHGAASELLGETARACESYRAALAHHLLYPWREQVFMALRRLDG
jgi:predicted Zn-dependent protease